MYWLWKRLGYARVNENGSCLSFEKFIHFKFLQIIFTFSVMNYLLRK